MKRIYVDWNGILGAFQMNVPEIKCFLDTEEGLVHKLSPGDSRLIEFQGQPARYLPISTVPSRVQYQWIDLYIASVSIVDIKEKMEVAVNGRGAFRRFKDILLTLPDQRKEWFEFRDKQIRNYIISWMQGLGIDPLNPPDWNNAEEGEILTSPPIINQVKESLLKEGIDPEQAQKLAEKLGKGFRISLA